MGGEGETTTFFQAHFIHRAQAKTGPDPIKNIYIYVYIHTYTYICKIILNTSNVME